MTHPVPPPEPATGEPAERRAPSPMRPLGIVADVGGVAGLAIAVLHQDLLLVAVAVVIVLLLFALQLRRRRPTVATVLLALACLAGGAAGAGAVLDRSPGTATAGPLATGGAPADPSASGTATVGASGDGPSATPPGTEATGGEDPADPGTDGGPRKLVDQTVVLAREAAVDVDHPDQRPVPHHVDGATGELDFYHDWGPVRSDTIQVVNAPNVYAYSGGPVARAYATCSADLAKSPYPAASPGGDFCFRTSRGRVGFATITRTRDDYAFVVHVVVWDGAGG